MGAIHFSIGMTEGSPKFVVDVKLGHGLCLCIIAWSVVYPPHWLLYKALFIKCLKSLLC